MSFDLDILPARPGMTSDDVAAAYERMDEGEAYPFGEPTDNLRACFDAIVEAFPLMSSLCDEEIDESIWSVDPDCTDGYIAMCTRWGTDQDCYEIILRTAHEHNLALWNPQSEELHLPPSLAPAGGQKLSPLHKLAGLFGFKKDS